MLVVVGIIGITWHERGINGQKHNPIILLVLLLATLALGYVALRFTQRLSRLKRAVEAINLRQLTTHVAVEGDDAISALAQSFNRMVDRLNAQETVRRQFFADLTHEIRHPLAILSARLESIQDGVVPLNEEQVLHLQDMVLGLKRMVTDMHELSLADVGTLSLHLAPIVASDLIEQLQANLAPVAEGADLIWVTEVAPDMPPVMGDVDRIRQVLTNLLTNAFHHTPAGGTVSLRARVEGKTAAFSVVDSGIGIASKDLPHLFERFYRGDTSRARQNGGSGLGLAIVRSLVELHQGQVEVVSTPGQGSCFTITLPLDRPGSEQPRDRRPESG
jgi:signal transduction histidine kinase